MKLSAGEMIIIKMLIDIYEKVVEEGGREIDLDLLRESVDHGLMWSVGRDMPQVLQVDEPPEEVVRETMKYLHMWHRIEQSYDGLDPKGREVVKIANQGQDLRFPGFNHKKEPHGAVARHMVDHMGWFKCFKDRVKDNPGLWVKKYAIMRAIFDDIIRGGVVEKLLSEDQISTILRGIDNSTTMDRL